MFLMGLNDGFSHVRGQILLMDPQPPITKVFFMVLQDETQRELGISLPEPSDSQVAFAVKGSQPKQQ